MPQPSSPSVFFAFMNSASSALSRRGLQPVSQQARRMRQLLTLGEDPRAAMMLDQLCELQARGRLEEIEPMTIALGIRLEMLTATDPVA